MISKKEFMNRIYGMDRRDDSNRCRIGAYMYDTSPNLVNINEMATTLRYKSEYGPGLGDKFDAATCRAEIKRIERRANDWGVPVAIYWHGDEVCQLIEKERPAKNPRNALPSNK